MEMERNGEVSKRSMLAVNGVTKRRRQITSLRDPIENGVDDDDDDRDRNRAFMNSVEWNRAFMNSQRKNSNNNKKKRNFDFYRGISEKSREGDDHRRSNRNRFSDEMLIGVAVPRKNRSASVKRLNTNWSFRNEGFGGLSHHRRFLVPSEVVTGRNGYCASSPDGLLRKNMKSYGLKRKLPKALEDSSVVQDDVENEVVEALFDLMNQTHSELDRSKKSEMDLVCTSGSHSEPVAEEKCIKTSHLCHKSGFFSRNNGCVKKSFGHSVLNDDLMAEDDNNLARSKYSGMPQATMDVTVDKEKACAKTGKELCNDSKRTARDNGVVDPQVVEKELQKNEVAPSNLSQGFLKLEHYASNSSCKSELIEEGEEPNQHKGLVSGGQKSDLPISLPFPVFGAGCARGLPHPGFMSPFQIFMPDRNAMSLTALARTPFLLTQCKRKRCVTHQYIAHNIVCHQQLIMNLSTLPAYASPVSIYDSGTPTHDALISKLTKTGQDEVKGEFMGKKKFSALSGDKTFGAGNSVNVSNDKQPMFQQSSEQIPMANGLGPALVGPLGQHQTLMTPPTNQNTSTLLSYTVKGALGSSSLSPVVSYNHINFPSKPMPPYLTIFPNNRYPFPFCTASRGEQAPAMPYVNVSYSSSPACHVSQSQPQKSLSKLMTPISAQCSHL